MTIDRVCKHICVTRAVLDLSKYAARNAFIESAPVSIVILPALSIHVRNPWEYIKKLRKPRLFHQKGARETPPHKLYTIRPNVPFAPEIPSAVGSIIYCPARSATWAVAAPDRALVKVPDEATDVPPVAGNSSTRTNAGVCGCKRILTSVGVGNSREYRTRVSFVHSPRTTLANIPAPSCGIGSTSTCRELHTLRENSPRCVGEKADMASVTSPWGRSAQRRAKPYV